MEKPWRQKAHKIINQLCRQSYLDANKKKDGTMRRRHVPYSVPEAAQELIDCLNKDDEERAKQMFLENYYISKLEP